MNHPEQAITPVDQPTQITEAEIRKQAAVAMGRARTPKKAASSAENGKKGGRPRLKSV